MSTRRAACAWTRAAGAAVARAGAAVVAAAIVLTGCASADPRASAEPSPSVSLSPAPPPPAAPEVGSCHALTLREATEPVDSGDPVPCRGPHTSVTVKVGRLSPVVDGHLLAIDSETVRAQIAQACPGDAAGFLGGDARTRRLSRFEVVSFSPSLEEADAGAHWYRCDVVALRTSGRLAELPRDLEGVLDDEAALDDYGTCGTSAPDRRAFERVICAEAHSWRAVDVVDLPRDARHLAEDATAVGDAACQDVAAERAGGSLRYTWSFEWPTRDQWDQGQRHGYCWVPD